MGAGTLTIFSASAGSGKTYTLTEIYLESLFRSRFSYRKILAVTFTNKATAEMKSRILDNLYRLATGGGSDYLGFLMEKTGKSEKWIREEAGMILNAILNDFSRFSVSTIDSFFQRILRSFTRDAGLHSGFNIELDHTEILSAAVDETLGSAVAGTQLNKWLSMYARTNIEEDRNWNLRKGIIQLSEELFREKFKILSAGEHAKLEDKELLLAYIDKLRAVSFSFGKKLIGFGQQAGNLFSQHELTDDMFYRKGQGVPGFIRSLAAGIIKDPNSYVREVEKSEPRWSTGAMAPPLRSALYNGLEKVILDALHFYDGHIKDYLTANSILSNIYALGILSDVLYNIHLITTEENSFLLSDAGEVLNRITAADQSGFIFEKAGNQYENFMIDEFQDTSIIQWNNLGPLIDNSMAQGYDNLVVGDIKQSIYRWRNSDWRILGSYLNSRIDNERYISKPLTRNWRSLSNIVTFNNSLFSVIPAQIDRIFEGEGDQISFRTIYSEAVQSYRTEKAGGYVRIEFLESDGEQNWKDSVLNRLPEVVELLQSKGYDASDIGIIVRDGREGASVLQRFIDYSSECSDEKRCKYNFNVVSSDSLLLSNSPAVNFIIAVLSVVCAPEDLISRALMLRYFLLSEGFEDPGNVSLESENLLLTSGKYFPVGYEAFIEGLTQLPLFEATESIIGFFGLGENLTNVPYLNTFQDYVVNFTGSKAGDVRSFLDWWQATGSRKSVVLPGNQNAMRILTIHKSKGLEFRVVILPFLSWNLDHMPMKQPFLWVKPETEPFNDLGIVPVRYSSELSKTWFAGEYSDEKHSAYVDNINLLYVAFTRAREVIYGFSADNAKPAGSIASVLKNALLQETQETGEACFDLSRFYNSDEKIFEYGTIPEKIREMRREAGMVSEKYVVSRAMDSLRLKLHGENYFSSSEIRMRERINYGKLMHEIFEGIRTPADIERAVRKMVLEGKVSEADSEDLHKRIGSLLSSPGVASWFEPGAEILTETGILMPSGHTRRPDRVIIRDGRVTIVDFKFGDESPAYLDQISQYRRLMKEMGYSVTEACIWYVDKNKIVSA